MAVKRKRSRTKDVKETPVENFSDLATPVMEPIKENRSGKMGKWGWVGIVVALLAVYWWKTNTWPVVAVVGVRPIFRHEVNRELFRQGGKSVVDSLVTERLVENELRKNNIKPGSEDIGAKIAQIKANFSSEADFQSALVERGLTISELERQLGLQVGIEKLLESRVEISASETAEFIAEMGSIMTSTTEAEREIEARNILRDQKLQQEINVWIEELRANGKVWWIGKV